MSCKGIWGLKSRPMQAQNRVAMPLNCWLFSLAIVRLCATSVLLQRLQLPRSQLRQGRHALAQGQLPMVQEEATEQKEHFGGFGWSNRASACSTYSGIDRCIWCFLSSQSMVIPRYCVPSQSSSTL